MWRLGSSRARYWHIRYLVPMADFSLCPHVKQGAGTFWGLFIPFIKVKSPFPKAPPPNTITRRSRFQHVNFGGTQTFSLHHKYSSVFPLFLVITYDMVLITSLVNISRFLILSVFQFLKHMASGFNYNFNQGRI